MIISSSASHPPRKMHARRNGNNLSISSTASSSTTYSSRSTLSPRIGSQQALLSRSPPPSPGLPPLPPRHGKKPLNSNSRLLRRLLLIFCGVVFIAWLGVREFFQSRNGLVYHSEAEGGDYELVGDSSLPPDPSALVVQDKSGKDKWTVHIPSKFDFPLKPAQYTEICSQSMELSRHLQEDAGKLHKRMRGYYTADPYFIDVDEAEEQGLMPSSKSPKWPKPVGMREGSQGAADGLMVCSTSLTYVMENSDAGIGKTLMGIWMAYGLAQKEGRAFFVDDTRWTYGNYTSLFSQPPLPSCLPPPAHHILPCPHSARHLVVSAATTAHTFGHNFNDEYQDARKMEVQRQHKIFALMRDGYEALFQLQKEDAAYVDVREKHLMSQIREDGGVAVGMHIRRGDRHPYEFQYSKDYLPLNRYLESARDFFYDSITYSNGSPSSRKTRKALQQRHSTPADTSSYLHELMDETHSTLLMASDDPDIYHAAEMAPANRAQDRIILASKSDLEAATPANAKHKYIDEISGWEGGFFKSVFWSLGRTTGTAQDRAPNSPSATGKILPVTHETRRHAHEEPATATGPADAHSSKVAIAASQNAPPRLDDAEGVPEGVMKLRELVGRAYLLDLAVLGRSDKIVCTVSSTGCRLLAVMMGWEEAINKGSWKNVDGMWDWRGIDW